MARSSSPRRTRFLQDSSANICCGSFHPWERGCNLPNPPSSYLFIRFPSIHPMKRFLRRLDFISCVYHALFPTIGRTEWFLGTKKKRKEFGSRRKFVRRKEREKEERERDISWGGITVEFRLISMEAFSFSSDRLARRIVERTKGGGGGGTKDKELEGDGEGEEDKDKEVHS